MKTGTPLRLSRNLFARLVHRMERPRVSSIPNMLRAGLTLAIGLTGFVAAANEPVIGPVPRWRRHEANPILRPGFEAKFGAPMGVSIGEPTVLYDEQQDLWKMWFSYAWEEEGRRMVVIKYAESPDGLAWSVATEPAFEPSALSTAWDATHVDSPTVIKHMDSPNSRLYALWYSGGNIFKKAAGGKKPWQQLGLAYSEDGRHFSRLSAVESPHGKEGLVLTAKDALPQDPDAAGGMLMDPEVILHGGVYHLWCSASSPDAEDIFIGSGIIHATSRDGINWATTEVGPLRQLHGGSMVAGRQPTVLWNSARQRFEMWFTSDAEHELEQIPVSASATYGYWAAVSPDGAEWTVEEKRDFVWDDSVGSEGYGLATGADVVLKDGEYRLYYSAFDNAQAIPGQGPRLMRVLNLATRPSEEDG